MFCCLSCRSEPIVNGVAAARHLNCGARRWMRFAWQKSQGHSRRRGGLGRRTAAVNSVPSLADHRSNLRCGDHTTAAFGELQFEPANSGHPSAVDQHGFHGSRKLETLEGRPATLCFQIFATDGLRLVQVENGQCRAETGGDLAVLAGRRVGIHEPARVAAADFGDPFRQEILLVYQPGRKRSKCIQK